MRSAIYYPNFEVRDPSVLRTALLMWDELHVIAPFKGLLPYYPDQGFAEAWELIGRTMVPDHAQKEKAHEDLVDFARRPLPADAYYRVESPPEDFYDIYPQKLLPKTWLALSEEGIVGPPLADGDYPFQQQVGVAVMAKLADACAGDVFARITDRLLAFGMVAGRTEEGVGAEPLDIVPMTIPMLDVDAIPLERLLAFRRKEQSERLGGDYKAMRHAYAEKVAGHLDQRKAIASANQLKQLDRQFADDMAQDLKQLRDALGGGNLKLLTAPAIVSTAVAAGAWIAHHSVIADAATAAAAMAMVKAFAPTEAITKAIELFKVGDEFSRSQRETMSKHPMAYIYALNRRRR